ncbi:MAG: cob(I)yrinic acid a,c-diamide adenosyltransferase [Armatimonadota bacterium]
MEKGYVQVYTGNGKGKTTAALGVVVRAIGAGYKVFIGQFLKAEDCSELHALESFSDTVTIKQYGRGCFIMNIPCEEDVVAAREGFDEIRDIVISGKYDIVILDEANIAVYYNMIDLSELLDLIKNKPDNVELIITGRYAKPELIEAADLVTEMKEIKHYYNSGVPARKGIEK